MPERDWDQHYEQGETPWDTDIPEPELVEYVRARGLHAGRVLDVGCGTGTHAIWLATQGFDVVGVDIAAPAVERARERATRADVAGRVHFEVLDFLHVRPQGGPFDLVFDRGVFHVFDAAEDRARFAEQVAHCLAAEGQWLSHIGSTEGPAREEGPPRRSVRDVAAAVEPVLEIIELRATCFDPARPVPPSAWRCVARRRRVPAQPSTTR